MNTGTIKCLVIGEFYSGKTTLMRRLESDVFEVTSPTIGVEFSVMDVPLIDDRITMWNLAGSERFQEILNLYYKGAQVILVVVDATKSSDIEKWITKARRLAPKARIALVFTKIDLPMRYSPNDIDLVRSMFDVDYATMVSSKEMSKKEIMSVLAPAFRNVQARNSIIVEDASSSSLSALSCCRVQ